MHFPVSPKHATFHAYFKLLNFSSRYSYGLPYQVFVLFVRPLGPEYVAYGSKCRQCYSGMQLHVDSASLYT